MRAYGLILIAAVGLTGCAATTGPTYTERVADLSTVQESSARLVFFRPTGVREHAKELVFIKVDGGSGGTCAYGAFEMMDVRPGRHVVTVELLGHPGACTVYVDLAGQTEHFFEVRPRVAAGLARSFLGSIGAAIESSGKECGGAFSVEQVSRERAMSRLKDLRMTTP